MEGNELQQIDERVRQLVVALNAFPGIATFSSCDGHPKPLLPSQRPFGEFEVNFNLYPLHGGGDLWSWLLLP